MLRMLSRALARRRGDCVGAAYERESLRARLGEKTPPPFAGWPIQMLDFISDRRVLVLELRWRYAIANGYFGSVCGCVFEDYATTT